MNTNDSIPGHLPKTLFFLAEMPISSPGGGEGEGDISSAGSRATHVGGDGPGKAGGSALPGMGFN